MSSNAKLIEIRGLEPLSYFAQSATGCVALRFKRRERIFSQATPADSLFYIQEGRVKLTVVSPTGREATLGLLHPRDFMGEECVARDEALRVATAIAMEDSRILRLEVKLVREALEKDRNFLGYFLSFLLNRHVRLQEDLIDHLCHSSEQRLARILWLLAGFHQSDEMEAIVAKISQEVLAEMVGTTRSRVSFFMNRFRERGFVDYNGALRIRRSLAAVIAGNELEFCQQ